jgi:hypothetical protein
MDARGRPSQAPDALLRTALKSQYHAVLTMLRTAIRRYPDALWTRDDGHVNPPWRIAYHTLYYAHWYLLGDSSRLPSWTRHRRGIRRLNRPANMVRPYTKAELLAYWRICDSAVDDAVDALDLGSARSGFSWYRMSRAEHQLVSIHHIEYHQAQLGDRMRRTTGAGVNWERGRRNSPARRVPAGRRGR